MLKNFTVNLILLSILAISVIAGITVRPVEAATPSLTDGSNSWEGIQQQATAISQQASAIINASQAIQTYASQIQANESNPSINEWASGIIALAAQTEHDAAEIKTLADTINTRIDNSEGTTLELAYQIGVMADRIGVMADRILWTELQIGVMADRIVESEHLISDSSLNLAHMIQDSSNTIATNANAIAEEATAIKDLLP